MKKRVILGALVAFLCLASAAGGIYLAQSDLWLIKSARNYALPKKTTGKYKRAVDYVFGSYHDLKVSTYTIMRGGPASGGGLALADAKRVLLMLGDGRSYLVQADTDDIELEPLKMAPPLEQECYAKSNPCGRKRWYRVTDIMLAPGQGPERLLYAVTTHFNREQGCYTLRLSEAKVSFETSSGSDWTVRFETSPCIKVLLGNESGGRLAFLDDSTILMTTGVFGALDQDLTGNPKFQYGKVLAININDWTARIFTSGERNPQGLLVDGGEIWETEHGPQGGDELNLLSEGNDYGWPEESYGTAYGTKSLTPDGPAGDHSHTARPIFSWSPAIGPSNLVRVHGEGFDAWKGDLFIASKNGRSLIRTRVRNGRVVTAERLKTGQRIEDLVELPDGRLVMWSGWNRIQVVEPGDQIAAACMGCHKLYHGAQSIGPDLIGVVGSPTARNKSYGYSEALRNFGGRWTRDRLDAFLTNPQATVPGTTMDFPGIADANKRKQIIDYLEKLSVPGSAKM